MKNVLTIILTTLSILAMSQNYKLFNANSKKLYGDLPSEDSTFSLAFDSVKSVGTDSVYFIYTGLGDEIETDSCEFWGAEWCIQQSKPSWLGSHVICDNIGGYRFLTAQSDTLHFNFSLLPGDSSLFYQDESQGFFMVFEGIDTTTVMNIADSAKFYRISHTDASGNIINSALNGKRIIVGKAMGLIEFFRIDEFPEVLLPLNLIGNVSPDAGLLGLTNEMIYDHQPGDEIQYRDIYDMEEGPPWCNYHRYIKHLFLDRIDTQDSIIYKVARFTFEVGDSAQLCDTITLKYKKDEVLASIPFDYIDQSNKLVIKKLYKADCCGLNFWTYTITPEYLIYCDDDNCWGSYDIPGPPPEEKTIYVCGLGLYSDESSIIYPPPTGYWYWYGIIYFKKNEIICGEEIIVGIGDPDRSVDLFNVYPNPAHDFIIIQSQATGNSIITISEMNGQEIMKSIINDPVSRIDIGRLKSGMYLVKLISGNNVEVMKIIKE
ncbi:MAG: T9SS type A sorting domain-containing protein [Bacteroidetes bacterium]|nr:T9SS type A sorting domain-containing protein [Bacteroidota bacterium]